MAKPTGTPPSPVPQTANYELPPLPPSPDDAAGYASQGTLPKAKDGPQMKQSSVQAPPLPPRGRSSSMVSRMVVKWDAVSPISSHSGQGGGKATTVAHAGTTVQHASNPAIIPRSTGHKVDGSGSVPFTASQPPSDAPPPLVLPLPPSDAPPPASVAWRGCG